MGVWREEGYEAFADGTFGNGGQNLYVSRAGVLQRIWRFDLDRNGWMDLVFVNSQDMDERPAVCVVRDPLGNAEVTELPTRGAMWGATGDLNGDGLDELVIANQHDGIHSDVTAFVYYGSAEGLSEKHRIELPAPNARGVAIGDFNGDGLADIAFSSDGQLRIFYQQPGGGFVASEYVDLALEATHMTAGDMDGDGCADLYVRLAGGRPRVLWGGRDGIRLSRFTGVGGADDLAEDLESSTPNRLQTVETWLPKIVRLGGVVHLFRQEAGEARFYPVKANGALVKANGELVKANGELVKANRRLGPPLRIACANALSAAAGDINGNGLEDIVVACCRDHNEEEESWIYWGVPGGYDNEHRTALSTRCARDVAVGDLNRNGFSDVVVCQGKTDILHSTESRVFRGSATGIDGKPVRLTTHDATTALIARTCQDDTPQVIFINHEGGRVRGDVPTYVYHGGPDGFSPARRTELLSWAAPIAGSCDFNDNGWADLLICNCSENAMDLDPGSFIYEGGPEGFREERKVVLPTVRSHGVAVGDFRRRGSLDVVSVGFCSAELTVFRGGENGFDLENPQRIVMDPGQSDYVPERSLEWVNRNYGTREFNDPRGLLAADFNNNGWLDLWVSQISGPRCLILWGGPEGFSMERATWLATEGADRAQAADLTGNGYLDLVIAGYQCLKKRVFHESSITIYYGGPDGFREDRKCELPMHQCGGVTIADFNNNGVLDIFGACYNSGRERDLNSFIYWGERGGGYSVRRRKRLWTHSACGAIAADFNEDGWVDLAIVNHKTYGNHAGLSTVWWNGPEGFSEARRTFLPTLGPHGTLCVDPGNIMDRGPEEYYVSSAFELPEGARVTGMRWEAEIQEKTWVRGQVRFAKRKEDLAKAAWQGTNGEDSAWLENDEATGRLRHEGGWIQYRLALGAVNGGNSPRVRAVEIAFRT